jgi:hypothetical protein
MARATPWIAPQCNNVNKSLHYKVKYKPLKNGRFWGNFGPDVAAACRLATQLFWLGFV